MLSNEAFERLCRSLNWSAEACEIASQIRTSDPARLVRGGRGNVRGRYPSRLMGCVIQFDSHTCELPWILDMEHYQKDVLEFWDQPITLRIEYKNKNGRKVFVMYTPDFFVLRETYAEFVECKTEEELIKLANAQPHRYHLDGEGKWRCPPGEEYAARLGFIFRVVSTAEIDRVHIRNTVFLEDYLGTDTPPVAAELRDKILPLVHRETGVLLADLLDGAIDMGATADDVYTLIAMGVIFVNLRAEPLAARERVWVYSDYESARRNSPEALSVPSPKGKFIEVAEGTCIQWNDSILTIIYVDEFKIYLEGEKGAEPSLTFSRFETLVKKGDIKGIGTASDPDPESRWKEIWNNANENRKAEANRRLQILRRCQDKRFLPEEVKLRTLDRWKARHRAAERTYGNGLVGLLPDWNLRGDRKTERLHPDARRIMHDAIECEYETLVQRGMLLVWGGVVTECEERKITPPSYVTFIHYVKRRPRHIQTLKRMGDRAAYALKPFYFWLETDTPRHGDRPFEVCHIDHTQMDVDLIDPNSGEDLGRPWVTFMIDAYSRRILAVYLTYDPPSYRSNMMVIRECVRRTGRLPQTVVVDGGADFRSVYFETLAAAFEITIKTRPGNQPRFGSVIERVFNTLNSQFAHNLIGNTQIMRGVRQVTKANDPRRLAIWSLGPLYEALCDWAYNRYDTQEHWTLKQAPRDAYFSALRITGLRRHRLIRYDEEFKILTLPSTVKRTAKNIAGRGVKINNEYYWCDSLGDAEVEGEDLPVRYDPFNQAIAYVYIGDKWVRCLAFNYRELEGLTEREKIIMSAEKRMRNRRYSRRLADRAVERALKHRADREMEVEQSEQLRLLRKKKSENDMVLKLINDRQEHASTLHKPWVEDNTVRFQETQVAPKRSIFSDIDVNELGSLEVYQG